LKFAILLVNLLTLASFTYICCTGKKLAIWFHPLLWSCWNQSNGYKWLMNILF